MNAYFFPISNQDREDILAKHRELYNGYQTLNPAAVNQTQPLYTQDFANDKLGMVVNNKGEVKPYTNMGINESVQESKKDVCEQCGGQLTEGMCNECDYTNEVTEQTHEGGQVDVAMIGDTIMGSQIFQELFNSVDPAEFEDEFEYADNIISWAIEDFIEDEPLYDDLYDYIKQMYSESLFDAYRVTMGDDFFGDDDIEDIDFEEIDEIEADDMDISSEEPAYDFKSDGPVDVYGTMQDYDDETDSYHKIDSMKDVERYDDSSDINDMFGDMVDGLAFNDNDPSDTFQHDAGDVDREGDGNLGMDTEDDMDLSDVKPAYTFVSGGSDDPYNEEEDIEEEIDEDLRESFSEKRKLIKEMFGRMSKFN